MKDVTAMESSAVFEEKLHQVILSFLPKGIRVAMWFAWTTLAVLIAIDTLRPVDVRPQFVFVSCFAIYASLIHGLLKKGWLGRRMLYFIPLIPMCFPTAFCIIATASMPEKAQYFLTGPFSYSYFIIIIITGFLFNYRYSVAIGVLCAVGFFACYLHARASLPLLSAGTEGMLSPLVFGIRSLLMVFAGFLVGEWSKIAKYLVMKILSEEQQKQHITNTFGMTVDRRVLDLMIQKKIELGGETRENTVLFADIRGFTTFSQEMPPSDLFVFMKEYFDLVSAEIQIEDGTILEYIGDEVMALFGAPLPIEAHPEKACLAALRMQRLLAAHNPRWVETGRPLVRAGVGIHTGPMLVGCIGSSARHKYGVLGDSVNLASRLQTLTKDYGVSIIASEETVGRCRGRFRTRQLDTLRVRGRTEEVTVYEIVSTVDETLDPRKLDFIAAYEDALENYRSGSASALTLFQRCLELEPQDRASARFIEKIQNESARRG